MQKRKETIIETYQVKIIRRRKGGVPASLDSRLTALQPAPSAGDSKEDRPQNTKEERDEK